MGDTLFEFRWDVDGEGYRWVKARRADKPEDDYFLTSGRPLGVSGEVTRYAPMRLYPALFRTFAEVEPTREGIQTFANRFGPLGIDEMIEVPIPPDGRHAILGQREGSEEKWTMSVGETRAAWFKEITAMRRAIELWDMVQVRDARGLARRIYWMAPDAVMYTDKPGGPAGPDEPGVAYAMAWIATDKIHPERLERFRHGELALPALSYVQEIVNKHLEERVSPRLLWEQDRSRLGLYFVPGSLIGALWLQLAQAINGNKKYARCQECGTPFEVSPETARTSKLFCSNACRSKAYRERIAEAQRLHAEGRGVEEIADILGSDVKTVEGWLAKEEPNKGRKERR